MASRRDARLRAAVSTARQGSAFWRPPRMQGPEKLGSLIYVGKGLHSVRGNGPEPALIDLTLPGRRTAECGQRRLDQWPSFSTCSPAARSSYLWWLRTGRCDPAADIGYVWLFFHGLERRLLHDALCDPAAAAERPLLVEEIERLLGVYAQDATFEQQALRLLDFLVLQDPSAREYLEPPRPHKGARLSLRDRVALGQCAQDRAALPADWALQWVRHGSDLSQRVPAALGQEFGTIFTALYRERYGAGLRLADGPPRHPRLKGDYWPASPTFQGHENGITHSTAIADVTSRASPPGELSGLADQALGRVRSCPQESPLIPMLSARDLAAVPPGRWPGCHHKALTELAQMVAQNGGQLPLPLFSLQSFVPMPERTLSRDQHDVLCQVLAGVGLGMEPDARFGGSSPAHASGIVLFLDDPGGGAARASDDYIAASQTVRLAASLVLAEGPLNVARCTRVQGWVERLLHLSKSERLRLQALLRRVLLEPPRRGAAPRRESLPSGQAREEACDLLVEVAGADGRLTREEIRWLERASVALGEGHSGLIARVEAAQRAGRLPLTEAGRESVLRTRSPRPGERRRRIVLQPREAPLLLDPERVAALQRESEELSKLLDPVFAPDEPAACSQADTPHPHPDEAAHPPGRLGLGPAASGFLSVLLRKSQWSRTELAAVAREHRLPLDGVLEHLNEASYEHLDVPLFEQWEPLVLNPEAIEKLDVEEEPK